MSIFLKRAAVVSVGVAFALFMACVITSLALTLGQMWGVL